MPGINLWYDLDWDDSECDEDNDLTKMGIDR
jgi:hypothetical protein